MTGDMQLTGVDGMLRLSKALKEAGRKQMRAELHKALKKSAKPVTEATRARAREILPQTGGLADRVARAPQSTKVMTGKNPGIRVSAGKAGSGAKRADKGYVMHPLFGDREHWYRTTFESGWFTQTALGLQPLVLSNVNAALERVCDQIAQEVGR